MSKKRKTRKQKEAAALRVAEHIHITPAPIYSISEVKKAPTRNVLKKVESKSVEHDYDYLRKDMIAISTASGIILSFDVLLLVLLSTGILRMNFLGY